MNVRIVYTISSSRTRIKIGAVAAQLPTFDSAMGTDTTTGEPAIRADPKVGRLEAEPVGDARGVAPGGTRQTGD